MKIIHLNAFVELAAALKTERIQSSDVHDCVSDARMNTWMAVVWMATGSSINVIKASV